MFCNQCGRQVESGSQFCAGCGKSVQEQPVNTTTYYGPAGQPRQGDNNINTYYENAPKKDEGNAFWWGVLCFFIPIVGIILYFQWRQVYPKRAKVCLWCSIAGFITNIALMSSGSLDSLSFQLTETFN